MVSSILNHTANLAAGGMQNRLAKPIAEFAQLNPDSQSLDLGATQPNLPTSQKTPTALPIFHDYPFAPHHRMVDGPVHRVPSLPFSTQETSTQSTEELIPAGSLSVDA